VNSRERDLRPLAREPGARLPVGPMLMDFGARVLDVPVGVFCQDAELMARANIETWERIGQDIVFLGSDNYYIAEGFGCGVAHPDDETPHLEHPPLEHISDVHRLRVPDPLTDGRMPVFIEATRRVRDALGDDVAIRTPGTGPFALASYFVGTQEFLIEVAMANYELPESDADAIHHALDLAADALIAFGKACVDAGADILHCGDSLASCDVISPADYERWAFPYERKVIQAWKEYGARTLLHICGDSSKVLHLYAETGADIIEVDHKVDLAHAIELVAGRSCLIGNLDPVTVLLQGSEERVRAEAERCAAVAAGTGYVLGSGCVVPRFTPIENLVAMVDVARRTEV
jgi:uroporphyrinogen decarboxylase